MSDRTVLCAQCGAIVPVSDGPTHAYVPSAPGRWQTFGEVQADEALRFGYPPAHRMVVDAYRAQHPGDGNDRHDRRSVFAHLVGLCAVLERGLAPEKTTRVLGQVLYDREDLPVLHRNHGPGDLTIVDLRDARDAQDYHDRARSWATVVWATWEEQHALIRTAVEAAALR